ncbi:MAG: thiamine pyrophosphate-binding protein [Betaproteobacteria bacterium]|nr:MAG: thiamine pyrophosphate-binding protein [Betaproteobacteria bacterium]
MARMTGAQAMVRYLEEEGIQYVFGMAGHANLAFLDALHESSIRFISVPHEQIAVHMADAYYRVTHRPAVVLTSVGPGFTNTVTGVADAMHDCSAIVLISGNVPIAHRGTEAYQEIAFHQDAAQTEVLKPIVKRAFRVDDRRLLGEIMARAFNNALGGVPGPVLVDIPMDMFSVMDDFSPSGTPARRPTSQRSAADEAEVRKAVEILKSGKRPVIYAGGGTILSEATEEVTALAERLGSPVITSLIAQSIIDNDHPLFGGVTGAVGTRTAHHLASQADTVLLIGSRLSDMDTCSWHPEMFFNVPPARIVQIDIDPSQVGRRFPVDVGIVADARTALRQLLAALPPDEGLAKPSAWLRAHDEQRKRWRAELEGSQRSNDVPILPERLIAEIRAALPASGILVAPNGPRYFVAQHFSAHGPRTHLVASGHGTMGWAVPAALGAKLGRPHSPVICLTGDGGFRSTNPCLAVAVEADIPVVWVILNNGGFNIIELIEKRFFKRGIGGAFRTTSGQRYNPDFVALARAYGVGAIRVERSEEIGPALREAITSGRPFVVDVAVTQQPQLRASGYWEANRYLTRGWNESEDKESARGFGDSA